MSSALVERPTEAIALPKDQIDLIKRTVANGATNDELALFLYDCQRRGIHPLDKLLHFTKRGGRYTPVTSIDFMRSQAAATGEMAGSDDPVFALNQVREGLDSATVTVYRITQGQRFAYTATARWAEYCPDNAPMWKRMPHTMLGKCAEALALRKAFPQQLAGLYSREEMDQADEPKGYVVTAPQHESRSLDGDRHVLESRSGNQGTRNRRELPDEARTASGQVGDGADPKGGVDVSVTQTRAGSEPADSLFIERVERKPTKNKTVTRYIAVLSDGRKPSFIKDQLAAIADECCQNGEAITVETEQSSFGENLTAIHRVERTIQLHADAPGVEPGEIVPF